MELKGQPLPPDLIIPLLILKTTEDASEKKKQPILFRHTGAVTFHMCALGVVARRLRESCPPYSSVFL